MPAKVLGLSWERCLEPIVTPCDSPRTEPVASLAHVTGPPYPRSVRLLSNIFMARKKRPIRDGRTDSSAAIGNS